MATTIEHVTYKLKAEITEDQLSATHDMVNQFLTAQKGFLYRSCSKDESGLLYDIVYWQSKEDAMTAGEAFMNHPAGLALMSLSDEATIKMTHMETLTESSMCSEAA